MNNIPKKIVKECTEDIFYKKCSRSKVFRDHVCEGRITWEHVFTYSGKQIQKRWNIIPLCEKAHSVGRFQTEGGILDKKKNELIALVRAYDLIGFEELKRSYPRKDWENNFRDLLIKYERSDNFNR